MIVRAAWRMAPVLGPRAACLSAPHTRTSRFLTTKAAANRSPASSPIVCLLLGGPGAGKGTQCERLVERFDLHHLSIGELLRKELSIYHELTKAPEVVDGREATPDDYTKAELPMTGPGAMGAVIGQAIREGKMLPGTVTVTLLKQELGRLQEESARSPHTRPPVVIIDGFPRTLENMNTWETHIGPLALMLFLKATSQEMTARVLRRGRDDDDMQTIWRRLLRFETETMLVVRRFMHDSRRFILTVDGMGTVEEVEHGMHQALTTLIKAQAPELDLYSYEKPHDIADHK